MEKRDTIVEAIGTLALRQHEMELETRDIMDTQKAAKRKTEKLVALAYINLFFEVAIIAAIWTR